tara:strand:- start:471 stop:902 length:432 start_codon:yes stop_codon:yes gene_type:complete
MKIILKSKNGNKRTEGSLDIQDIIIREDISDLDNTKVSLDLGNENSEGVIEFSYKEIENLIQSIQDKVLRKNEIPEMGDISNRDEITIEEDPLIITKNDLNGLEGLESKLEDVVRSKVKKVKKKRKKRKVKVKKIKKKKIKKK